MTMILKVKTAMTTMKATIMTTIMTKKVKTIVTTIMTTMMTTTISTMVFLPVVATSRCPIPLGWPSFDKLCLKKLFKEKLPQTVSKKKLKSCDKLCSIFLKRFDKLCLKK